MNSTNAETVLKIRELNKNFYETVAPHFSATRDYAWAGWDILAENFAEQGISPKSILDLGCGNGRFAAFAHEKFSYTLYIGVDSNGSLLADGRRDNTSPSTEFLQADILDFPELSVPETKFDLVVLFGVMHHIPGFEQQTALLKYAAKFLNPNGTLAVSFWNFLSVPKLKNKIVEPQLAGIDPAELATNDYILNWQRGAVAYRFCHFYSDSEILTLAKTANLEIINSFQADGPTGISNDYRIFKRK